MTLHGSAFTSVVGRLKLELLDKAVHTISGERSICDGSSKVSGAKNSRSESYSLSSFLAIAHLPFAMCLLSSFHHD